MILESSERAEQSIEPLVVQFRYSDTEALKKRK
jgi:hypothetical protein